MGTEKRERQRANKALKEQQVAKAQAKNKSMRLGIIVVGAIVAVIAIALAANAFVGGDDDTTPTEDEFAFDANDQLDAVDEAATDDLPVIESSLECPPVEGTETRTVSFEEQPPMCLEDGVTYTAQVVTNKGEITMALDQEKAPITVNNFVFLARNKYYDSLTCHRIVTDFVIQCGDPDGTGGGGPGYQIADELPGEGEYRTGSLAMANSGPNTNGSQFFIVLSESGASALEPLYSLFGEVSAGFDETAKPIEAAGSATGAPSEPIVIESVTIIES